MKKAQLVLVPAPGIGHLVSNIEFAKRLLDHDNSFSIIALIIRPPFPIPKLDSYIQSLAATETQIQFISLPQATQFSPVDALKSFEKSLSDYMEAHKPFVKEAIVNHGSNNFVPLPLAGLVIDYFCSSMIDVANELGVPSYIFYTSSAASFGLTLYLPDRHDEVGTEFKANDPEFIDLPSYVNPVPSAVLPSVLFNKDGGYLSFQNHARRFKEAKGIIVNSFSQLEPHAFNSFVDENGKAKTSQVYPVGPLLNLKGSIARDHEIMKWLDDQPMQSVVFLCFGSLGSFSESQLKEIATGLEMSGQRFLWSIRKSPPKGEFAPPTNFTSYEEILPNGFLERTKEMGMVCGWAPQVQILAHKAIGGFVSHCGWNSILESLWYGVPIVTWPMYAEQQINAFEMVKDLGLAIQLRLDYGSYYNHFVSADEISKSVRCIMEDGSEVRNRVREMSEMSRKAVMEGGSSFDAFQCLIHHMLAAM